MKKLALAFFLFGYGASLSAQEIISLTNPSFEDDPGWGIVPEGWYDCGFIFESPPDVQPARWKNNHPIYDNALKAVDGDTYLAMVTRDNETWERIGQKLSSPLKKGHTYSLRLSLAIATRYLSRSRKNGAPSNFNRTVQLRVSGGMEPCELGDLLFVSHNVNNPDWESYEFTFVASENWEYIMLEAFYVNSLLSPYNGNILVDNCSEIIDISATDQAGEFLVNKLSELERHRTLTPLEIETSLSEYYQFNWELEDELMPLSNELSDLWYFMQQVPKTGLRQYILESKPQHIHSIVGLLEKVGALDCAASLEEVGGIWLKKQNGEVLTGEDQATFEHCEAPFREIFEQEDPWFFYRLYLEEHQMAFDAELRILEQDIAQNGDTWD